MISESEYNAYRSAIYLLNTREYKPADFGHYGQAVNLLATLVKEYERVKEEESSVDQSAGSDVQDSTSET